MTLLHESVIAPRMTIDFSKKNKFKVMDVPMTKPDGETESELISDLSLLMKKENIDIDPSKIVAIHRIPGKAGHEKPILIKLSNNNEKTKIMTHRSAFKAMGRRLVDDVTKSNAELNETQPDYPGVVL